MPQAPVAGTPLVQYLGADQAAKLCAAFGGNRPDIPKATRLLNLLRDGDIGLIKGLYALCPYIAGQWPQERFPSSIENEGYLRTLVRQAPREVALVLALFLNAPQELLELALTSFRRVGRAGERTADNRRVAALLGLPEDSKPLDSVERYLIGKE